MNADTGNPNMKAGTGNTNLCKHTLKCVPVAA